jgi:hypothetical protein
MVCSNPLGGGGPPLRAVRAIIPHCDTASGRAAADPHSAAVPAGLVPPQRLLSDGALASAVPAYGSGFSWNLALQSRLQK